MSWWEALLLGIVEGLTEYLPVSSTGHLTITEYLLGKNIADVGMVAFTAVIQIGAIAAAVIYFWGDIWRIAKAWVTGLFRREARRDPYYRFGWAIIVGSIPIAVVGLLFKDFIETGLRSMWFVAGGLVLWSAVLFTADRFSAKQTGTVSAERAGNEQNEYEPACNSAEASKTAQQFSRSSANGARAVAEQGGTVPDYSADASTTIPQALIIGLVQCFSLIPGVSRSGATISAGLFLGFDRVLATRLSFFLGIPALVAAGALQGITNFDKIGSTVGWGPTLIGLAVSFVVGYASIAWLLRFVSKHSFNAFIIYRLLVGGVIAVLLLSGTIPAV